MGETLKKRHEMDMGMGMGGGEGGAGVLTTKGVDFSNQTQAAEFLEALLNDDELKVIGSAYARYFWYGIAVAVGISAVVNVIRIATLRMRLRAVSQNREKPARPQNVLMRWIATITAMSRESTYLQFAAAQQPTWHRVPPMGTITLVLAHFAFVITLEFANNDVAGAQFWQARGVRAGWLAIAQLPLLIVLVGKYNIISLLSGVSYERLNVLHRWTARIMLLMAIFHFGYQSYGWQKFGLMTLEWNTDECPPTGIAAFVLLLWMNLSTFAPLRSWSYELFVVQHLITYFGFIIAVMYHLPDTALNTRIYVFVPIAIWFLDRCIQGLIYIYLSLNTTATITPLEGGATKIRLSSKRLRSWSPGSFILLSIPRYGWVQSHPATIVSTPTSHNGDIVLMLKCQRGFTKRILTAAETSSTALLPQTQPTRGEARATTYRAFVHGPYGGSQSDFGAFDSICLLAGSTGVTFTLSLLQDLADRAAAHKPLVVRRINFVWCVKSSSWAKWCNEEISSAFEKLRSAGIEVHVSIYVTCADAFTEQSDEPKECGCACDKSLGPCCCVLVDESDEVASEQGKVEPPTTNPSKNATVTEKPSSTTGEATTSTRLKVLPCASFHSGRPDVSQIMTDLLDRADGESAVAVCGPVAMSSSVRNVIVRLSDERAIHKGSGAQGVYLHVESFS